MNTATGGNRPRNREPWAVETKIHVSFWVFACLLLLLGGISFLTYQRYNNMDRWIAHTHLELQTLQDLLATVYRAEAGQRGYFISGKEIYLDDRHRAIARFDELTGELKHLTRNNPTLLPQAEALTELVGKRREILQHYLELYQTRGYEETAAEFGAGPPVMGEIRRVADTLQDDIRRLLTTRKEEEKVYEQQLLTLMAGLFTATSLFFAVMFFRVRRDLTLRRQADLEQKRLTDILDATPDYIATATPEGQYLYLNKGGRRLAGIGEVEDISGLTLADMHPPWASDLIRREGIPGALNTGSWMGETAVLIRGGQEFPASQVIIAHRDEQGAPVYLSTIARDIGAQKRAEREISDASLYDQTHGEVLRMFSTTFERKELLRGMLNILANHHPLPVSAVYVYDEWSGKLKLAASQSAPPGIATEVALGEGLAGEAAQENRTLLLEPSPRTAELTIATGLLSFHPAAVVACPIVYQEKRQGVLVVAASAPLGSRDRQFLERLCIQLGVALHNVQQYGDLKLLAEQLRLRSEEISNKNQQLEAASRMKSEFLANMSHELRTPLNAIIGFSEIMRDGLAGDLSDQQREYAADIFESGQHLLSLINDVLDLSKIEAGRMTLEAESADIAALLVNSLSILKEKAMAHHVRLVLRAPEEPCVCWLDPRKVKQIVYNLLSNAVKFTPAGGEVTLRARIVDREEVARHPPGPGEPRISLPAAGEKFLEIAVSDTGIGIAAEDLPRLFQPFVQLDSSFARRFEGTGLGLAMVRKLAELHGGTVAVASQPGRGSTFTVLLPCREEAAMPHEGTAVAGQTPPWPSGTPPLVLVVEDDDRAADLIRLQLETDHCRVVRAATAEAALALLEEDPLPDLISLDILLPGMDGWDFLAQLKAVPRLAHVPVVILSVVADANRNRGLSLGASAVLQKPVSAEELTEALAHLGMAPQAKSGQPTTVLVVDDDPNAVKILTSYLECAGFTVLRAYGGEEGIQLADSRLPDLIVLDLMMPGVSGFEVVETLKKQPKTSGIPILVLTAKLLTAEDRKLLNGHVLQVMEKSEFDHGNFIGEVRRALQRRRDVPAVTETGQAPWHAS
jgi:PAS domain S-box-containing protein